MADMRRRSRPFHTMEYIFRNTERWRLNKFSLGRLGDRQVGRERLDLVRKAVADVADYLIAKAEGLADARLSIETEYNYGDSEIIVQTIAGWRPATDAEIRHRQQEEEARVATARRRAELDLDRIRREHPDLLS